MMTEKKYILVTGSSGFIGKHLVKSLREQDYIVYEFDHDQGDIADFKLQFTKLDHIVHLASLIFIPASWEDPQSFYRTNVMGVVNVLETCRRYNCALTYISSYVYGTPKYLPVDEKHPVNPSSPYNHSKLIAEDVCRFYSKTFNIPVTIFPAVFSAPTISLSALDIIRKPPVTTPDPAPEISLIPSPTPLIASPTPPAESPRPLETGEISL